MKKGLLIAGAAGVYLLVRYLKNKAAVTQGGERVWLIVNYDDKRFLRDKVARVFCREYYRDGTEARFYCAVGDFLEKYIMDALNNGVVVSVILNNNPVNYTTKEEYLASLALTKSDE